MLLGSCLQEGRPFVGVSRGDAVVDLGALAPDLPGTLRGLLEVDPDLEQARSALGDGDAPAFDLNEVEFQPLIPDPQAIWCAALTFESHVTEAPDRKPPDYPVFFPRVAASQTGHRQPLVEPAVSDRLDYEGELAVVIGRRAHHVSEADALSYVAGYSCYDEGSVRDWQRHTPQIAPGKNFARTGAFGPWLATPDEFGDPYGHTITTRVNGEVRQRESIDSLLFRVEYLIHYLSQIHPLEPGDVVVCGTPGGVGMRREPPTFLSPGDLVSVEIDGIGTLENEVVAEADAERNWQPNDPR